MKKYITYKNLNLLLPVLGIFLMLIIFFFTSLKINVEVDGVVTDTIKISSYEIMFASRNQLYHTNLGLMFILFFIIDMGLLIGSNLGVYYKVKKIKFLPILGLFINLITFILCFALPFSASDSLLDFQLKMIGTGISIEHTIKELPILLSIFEFIAFFISYGFAIFNFKHLDKDLDDTFKVFKEIYSYQGIYIFMFWLTLIFYLFPLFVVILIFFFVFKEGINYNNKKTIIIDNKEYKVVGNKVFDNHNNQIGIIENNIFIRNEK